MTRGGGHALPQLFPALPSDPRGDYRRCNGRGRTAVQLSNFASVIVEDQESGVMMPASGWMRRWKSETAPEERKGALIRAAARGDSLTQVVEVAVHDLLQSCSADRAGIWLAGERRGEAGWGRVVEAKRGPIPEQWKHLDISTPFLRAALESRELLRGEIGRDDTLPPLGPFVGTPHPTWRPPPACAR